ncbi:hypothetical protein PUN28_012197 [Cardiocondyla obscurior]|uniref:Uncharacterized protein n=1 Tax=Cardiocondyla obscurior TaxID=286306 RepID=A0AAW2F9Y9_9HYME
MKNEAGNCQLLLITIILRDSFASLLFCIRFATIGHSNTESISLGLSLRIHLWTVPHIRYAVKIEVGFFVFHSVIENYFFYDNELFHPTLQPSVEVRSCGIGDFGCPNPIHKENMRLRTNPETALEMANIFFNECRINSQILFQCA